MTNFSVPGPRCSICRTAPAVTGILMHDPLAFWDVPEAWSWSCAECHPHVARAYTQILLLRPHLELRQYPVGLGASALVSAP
jgi:hypothetical protein